MKVTRDADDCSFEPFTLCVTIENVEELRDLWVRLNASHIGFSKYGSYPNAVADSSSCGKLFNALDEEASARGYP
jgi:hypothetical protein